MSQTYAEWYDEQEEMIEKEKEAIEQAKLQYEEYLENEN